MVTVLVNHVVQQRAMFFAPLGCWWPNLTVKFKIHLLIHSSVKPFLHSRDPGSYQLAELGFQQ